MMTGKQEFDQRIAASCWRQIFLKMRRLQQQQPSSYSTSSSFMLITSASLIEIKGKMSNMKIKGVSHTEIERRRERRVIEVVVAQLQRNLIKLANSKKRSKHVHTYTYIYIKRDQKQFSASWKEFRCREFESRGKIYGCYHHE